MLSLTKSYSQQFISDGIATELSFDMSLTPIKEDFRGNLPTGPNAILLASVSGPAGPVAGATFELVGTTVMITFPTAPPQLYNGSTALYTASWTLQFPN